MNNKLISLVIENKIIPLGQPPIIDAELRKTAINHLRGPQLLDVYTALPPALQSDKDIVRRAIGECVDSSILKLYAVLPDNVKEDAEITGRVIKQCDSELILELYRVLPINHQRDKNLATIAINQCDNTLLLELYRILPINHQHDKDLAKLLIARSKNPVKLYSAFQDSFKNDFEIGSLALHVDDFSVRLQVFQLLPQSLQQNRDIRRIMADGVFDFELTKNMPIDIVVKRYTQQLPDLLRTDSDVSSRIFANYAGITAQYPAQMLASGMRDMATLYAALPGDVQETRDTYNAFLAMIEKSTDMPVMYRLLPAKFQENTEIAKAAIAKAPVDQIPQLYPLLPERVRMDQQLAKLAMDQCPTDGMPTLFSSVPESLRTDTQLFELARAKWPKDLLQQLDRIGLLVTAKLAISQSDTTEAEVAKVYAALPEAVQLDKEVATLAIQHCHAAKKGELYHVMPEAVRYDSSIRPLFGHKSRTMGVPYTVNTLPPQVEQKTPHPGFTPEHFSEVVHNIREVYFPDARHPIDSRKKNSKYAYLEGEEPLKDASSRLAFRTQLAKIVAHMQISEEASLDRYEILILGVSMRFAPEALYRDFYRAIPLALRIDELDERLFPDPKDILAPGEQILALPVINIQTIMLEEKLDQAKKIMSATDPAPTWDQIVDLSRLMQRGTAENFMEFYRAIPSGIRSKGRDIELLSQPPLETLTLIEPLSKNTIKSIILHENGYTWAQIKLAKVFHKVPFLVAAVTSARVAYFIPDAISMHNLIQNYGFPFSYWGGMAGVVGFGLALAIRFALTIAAKAMTSTSTSTYRPLSVLSEEAIQHLFQQLKQRLPSRMHPFIEQYLFNPDRLPGKYLISLIKIFQAYHFLNTPVPKAHQNNP